MAQYSRSRTRSCSKHFSAVLNIFLFFFFLRGGGGGGGRGAGGGGGVPRTKTRKHYQSLYYTKYQFYTTDLTPHSRLLRLCLQMFLLSGQ